MVSEKENRIVEDWQSLVNKPVYSSNGKDIGIVQAIQPEFFITSHGSITKDRYLIPKTSLQSINDGIINIKEDSDFVEKNFRFE
jgi:hypothetical protein